jgi:hypothetical protein
VKRADETLDRMFINGKLPKASELPKVEGPPGVRGGNEKPSV